MHVINTMYVYNVCVISIDIGVDLEFIYFIYLSLATFRIFITLLPTSRLRVCFETNLAFAELSANCSSSIVIGC